MKAALKRPFRIKVAMPHFAAPPYSTVTDLARLRGWSTSQPRRTPMW
ncbi:MAG TPA: hypothetical protein VNO70_04940 [Blastocatellia bacterium]|nr:hypothetical protein [Blastocatellia bacterium]